jgi:glycerol-3-phosphate dehydrogenase
MKRDVANYRLADLKPRYDLIIIGGGIQGATMALEAASRRLSVLLLEKNDFGSGVSANSLKIIHGGIRYLQHFNLSRMRQSIRERRTLLRIAPHLVRPMQCLLPSHGGLTGNAALGLGARIYDWIALDRNRSLDTARHICPSKRISSEEFQAFCHVYPGSHASGGISWWDAQVHNSERLVLAFVMSARGLGADVCNYTKAEEIVVQKGRVRGVVAEDILTKEKREIRGDVVMDCSGPLFDISSAGNGRYFAMAMNLVVSRRLADCAIGIRQTGNARRSFFYVPWRDGGMIGTWYTHANGSVASGVTLNAVRAALVEINRALDGLDLKLEEVTAVHAGLIPALPGDANQAEPVIADRFLIVDGARKGVAGLFQVQGVKYTTARDVSIRALDAAGRYLNMSRKASNTHNLPLYGGDVGDVDNFKMSCLQRYSTDMSCTGVNRLVDNYGSRIHVIRDYANSSLKHARRVPGTSDVFQAELAYIVDHEMVRTLSDLIFRRTDLGSFAMPAEETIAFCADFLAGHLGWDAETRVLNIKRLYSQYPRWIQGMEKEA